MAPERVTLRRSRAQHGDARVEQLLLLEDKGRRGRRGEHVDALQQHDVSVEVDDRAPAQDGRRVEQEQLRKRRSVRSVRPRRRPRRWPTVGDDALALHARERGRRDVGQNRVEWQPRVHSAGAAAQPNDAGELGRRVAGQHRHEHGVARGACDRDITHTAVRAPLGLRAAQVLAPAIDALHKHSPVSRSQSSAGILRRGGRPSSRECSFYFTARLPHTPMEAQRNAGRGVARRAGARLHPCIHSTSRGLVVDPRAVCTMKNSSMLPRCRDKPGCCARHPGTPGCSDSKSPRTTAHVLWSAAATGLSRSCRATGTASPQLLFTHIPKTGGSFIEAAGRRTGSAWASTMSGAATRARTATSARHHVPFDEYRPPVRAANVLCVRRDPYERLVSEWKARVVLHALEFAQCPYDFAALRPRRTSLNADECAHHFNAYLAAVLPAYGRDASTCDCHLIPQVAYIHGRGGAAGGRRPICTHVLDFRNLTSELREFARAAGASPQFLRGSRQRHDRPNDSGNVVLRAERARPHRRQSSRRARGICGGFRRPRL